MIAPREPRKVEPLVSAHQRRLTVDDHAEFRARMAADLEPRTPPDSPDTNCRPFKSEASNPEPPQA